MTREVCRECPIDGMPCPLVREGFDSDDFDEDPCAFPEDCYCLDNCSFIEPSKTCCKNKKKGEVKP